MCYGFGLWFMVYVMFSVLRVDRVIKVRLLAVRLFTCNFNGAHVGAFLLYYKVSFVMGLFFGPDLMCVQCFFPEMKAHLPVLYVTLVPL